MSPKSLWRILFFIDEFFPAEPASGQCAESRERFGFARARESPPWRRFVHVRRRAPATPPVWRDDRGRDVLRIVRRCGTRPRRDSLARGDSRARTRPLPFRLSSLLRNGEGL